MRTRRLSVAGAAALVLLGVSLGALGGGASPAAAEAVTEAGAEPILLAQDGGTEPRELEPAYAPPPPGEPGPYNEAEGQGYNSDYLFGLTRSTARSTIVPAAKVPLFLFTIPLDIALLPFAAIGGFFG